MSYEPMCTPMIYHSQSFLNYYCATNEEEGIVYYSIGLVIFLPSLTYLLHKVKRKKNLVIKSQPG